MDRTRTFFLILAAGSLLLPVGRAATLPDAGSPSMKLTQGWAIQSSDDVRENGAAISAVGFDASQWYPATVPSTVLGALVKQRIYPEPGVGMNLRTIPGATYPIFTPFTDLQMPPESPFRHSWWYRTEFKLPDEYKGKTLWLGFDGVNYRANVWMNGHQIATSTKMVGTWRLFEFDVTAAAHPGEANALAVEVFPPQPDMSSII